MPPPGGVYGGGKTSRKIFGFTFRCTRFICMSIVQGDRERGRRFIRVFQIRFPLNIIHECRIKLNWNGFMCAWRFSRWQKYNCFNWFFNFVSLSLHFQLTTITLQVIGFWLFNVSCDIFIVYGFVVTPPGSGFLLLYTTSKFFLPASVRSVSLPIFENYSEKDGTTYQDFLCR